VTADGSKTNTISNGLFSELRIKLTCCNDNSNYSVMNRQRSRDKRWEPMNIMETKITKNNKGIPVENMK